MKTIVIWMAFCLPFTVHGQGVEGYYSAQLAQLKKRLETPASLWWARPLDNAWTKYEFVKIDVTRAKSLVKLFKGASFSDKAGNRALLELEYVDSDRIGQGVLIYDDGSVPNLAFCFDATFVNKKALGFVNVGKFLPDTKILQYEKVGYFPGVVLSGDFRKILLGDKSHKK